MRVRTVEPSYDPSASYVATNRLSVFNGVQMAEGDALPSPPKDPTARLKYDRLMGQLLSMRKITAAKKKEKR